MRKLLNTLYVTQEDYYLSRERDNIVVKQDGKVLKRFPYRILEGIVCFSYIGMSPSLIKLCNENGISITLLTPSGSFCGRFVGKTNGNVLLRREQYRIADDSNVSLDYAKRFIISKASNSRKYIQRIKRDHADKINTDSFKQTNAYIRKQIKEVNITKDKDSLRGIEGNIASTYFKTFNDIILKNNGIFYFEGRTKRPPMDRVNAMLSFGYSLLTNECQSALETVGLDSYVGFFHTDRPGRASLALDLVEEFRNYLVDRLVFSLINTGQVEKSHFEVKENNSVYLNEKGRTTFLTNWQKRKNREITHPFIDEKTKLGLLPYVQALLLSKTIRGDLGSYPPFLA